MLVFTIPNMAPTTSLEQLNKDGIRSAGSMATRARERVPAAGRLKSSIRVLVATDIAARGLDIELPHVVNLSCRTYRKITSTASAVPVARRPPAKPYRWCAWMSISCCAISSAC